jgi:regulation of enolase protein 1 (concanavalin A-like superfamily)
MLEFDTQKAFWINEPTKYEISRDRLVIQTEPDTDLWQKTYYNFQHDNAPMFLIKTREPFFSFTVKVSFDSKALFDQAGIAIYEDSDNWVKAAIEYHDNKTAWLGSVVTNNGYSDWATSVIGSDINCMWYRLSRREKDFCIENAGDGQHFNQMRIFCLQNCGDFINFGLCACSPSRSSFEAVFSDFKTSECMWAEHRP